MTVAPGHSLTIPVTITPSGAKGTVVSGQLFADKITLFGLDFLVPSGHELSAIPYRYTIG